MYDVRRFEGTYTPPLIEPPALWPRKKFAEPGVLGLKYGRTFAGNQLSLVGAFLPEVSGGAD